MSFCRIRPGVSDVYVYHDVRGALVCACGTVAKITEAMVAHLREHRGRGDLVPERAILRLLGEARELDAEMADERLASENLNDEPF